MYANLRIIRIKTQNSKVKSLRQRRILLRRKNYKLKVKSNVIASPEVSGRSNPNRSVASLRVPMLRHEAIPLDEF